jgi:glycerol-3-phosphate dehydrogenase (NAD(P)+)
MRVAVLGSGSWGTALASVLADIGHDVLLWARDVELARSIESDHRNPRYLRDCALPTTVHATADLGEALRGSELVVFVVPSHVLRATVESAASLLPPNVPLCCATKGIENDSLMVMSEVIEDVLPPERHPYLTVLSGPSFAQEVARGLPTNVVVAARWQRMAHLVQMAFARPTFRVYTSHDVIGVELGGALKNVIAIAAGASDGLGYGHNALAGLITRGLAEINRLAVKRGANPLTLSGLAGMGDLILTCTGELSRNRRVGLLLGQGQTLEEILSGMNQVAEGVRTTKSAHDLAWKMQVDMPLVDAVYSVLYEAVTAKTAVRNLLGRELKAEFQD